jgi:hypothetical protein
MPWGFQEVEVPRFQDNRHMKVVRLSALCTGRLYPPGNIPGTHLCERLSWPQGHSATGKIMSMKNSNDTIRNPTRKLPACSTVSKPTAPPRAPKSVTGKGESVLQLKANQNGQCVPKDSYLFTKLQCHIQNTVTLILVYDITWHDMSEYSNLSPPNLFSPHHPSMNYTVTFSGIPRMINKNSKQTHINQSCKISSVLSPH